MCLAMCALSSFLPLSLSQSMLIKHQINSTLPELIVEEKAGERCFFSVKRLMDFFLSRLASPESSRSKKLHFFPSKRFVDSFSSRYLIAAQSLISICPRSLFFLSFQNHKSQARDVLNIPITQPRHHHERWIFFRSRCVYAAQLIVWPWYLKAISI